MRKQVTESGVKLWASASDTYAWAHKTGASWPCSTLSGRRFFAEFAVNGDLVDLTVDGKNVGETIHMGASGGTVEVLAAAECIWPLGSIEIVNNGRAVAESK